LQKPQISFDSSSIHQGTKTKITLWENSLTMPEAYYFITQKTIGISYSENPHGMAT